MEDVFTPCRARDGLKRRYYSQVSAPSLHNRTLLCSMQPAQVIDTQRISEVGIAKICCINSEDDAKAALFSMCCQASSVCWVVCPLAGRLSTQSGRPPLRWQECWQCCIVQENWAIHVAIWTGRNMEHHAASEASKRKLLRARIPLTMFKGRWSSTPLPRNRMGFTCGIDAWALRHAEERKLSNVPFCTSPRSLGSATPTDLLTRLKSGSKVNTAGE